MKNPYTSFCVTCSETCVYYTCFGVITQVLEMPLLKEAKEEIKQALKPGQHPGGSVEENIG